MDESDHLLEKCRKAYRECFEKEPHPLIVQAIKHQSNQCLNVAGNVTTFSGEHLGDKDMLVMYKILKDQYLFVSVNLSYNNITDEGSHSVAQLIKSSSSLICLNLMCNDIGPKGGELIAAALQTNSTLESLNMNGNKIGRNGVLMFARALQFNIGLKELNVGHTDMNIDSMIAMATVLCFSNCTLLRINLNRPLLKNMEEEIISGHISHLLKMNPVLIELHLQQLGMEDYGATIISESLRNNTILTHLDLSCNRIGEDGMNMLADAMAVSGTTELLNIGYNRIGNTGAVYLADLLKVNTSLKTLIIVSNNIGVNGIITIIEVLINVNKSLTSLFIWGNDVQPSAGEAVHRLLEAKRLSEDCIDVKPYNIEGIFHLGRQFFFPPRQFGRAPSYGNCLTTSAMLKQ
ncbi:leucine-rich repeat-containing protein 34-like isoform X2 [Octopus sinensis]|uniref:Leucine-rich repeat-containing protein 34-like isoform X2 n=1 Tax=Octopus sinensis TaxID=2607531 RepID=A0A7E6FIP6_9MOLL|nr:leucine-rich repeat-containing protein 34-like isoform X2 [Octopus sinensis]